MPTYKLSASSNSYLIRQNYRPSIFCPLRERIRNYNFPVRYFELVAQKSQFRNESHVHVGENCECAPVARLFCMPRARFGPEAAAQKCRAQLAHGCALSLSARRQPHHKPPYSLWMRRRSLAAQLHVNSHAGIFAFALLIWCLRRCGAQGAGRWYARAPKHTYTRLAHIKCQDTHTHMGVGCRCFASFPRPANFGHIKVSQLGLRCERWRRGGQVRGLRPQDARRTRCERRQTCLEQSTPAWDRKVLES